MSRHVASVTIGRGRPEVKLYEVTHDFDRQSYYWCCEGDGACSKPHARLKHATEEAFLHFEESHKEHDNGPQR